MEEQGYSKIEVLDDAITTLGNLSLPVSLTDEVTVQINRVRKNLIVLANELVAQENAQAELHAVPDPEEEQAAEPEQEEVAVEEVGGTEE